MDRRKFLQSGSLAFLAVATLPKAVRSMGKESLTSHYRTNIDPNAQTQIVYEIILNDSGIDSFDTALEADKIITLKAGTFAGAGSTTPAQHAEFKYVIKSSKKGDNDMWTVTAKFDSKLSGDFTLDKNFTENLKFHYKQFTYVELLDKKGKKVVQSLEYYIPPASSTGASGGCFLTTACVQHKQLADDCEELSALRYLRDGFMKQTEQGNAMIAQYQITGPAIVKAIDSCENKAAIYDHMYSNMIMPSVELVKQGELDMAVDHYKAFVKALVKEYV